MADSGAVPLISAAITRSFWGLLLRGIHDSGPPAIADVPGLQAGKPGELANSARTLNNVGIGAIQGTLKCAASGRWSLLLRA
jgi:hypothetical protein